MTDERDVRRPLVADCQNCAGLCCVALPFTASSDFAIDKAAGEPCAHLRPDFRCGIHDRLRGAGFAGCQVYDCFGAGQQVTQVTFGGRDWVREPSVARQMFRVFPIMRRLHELLWYLAEALTRPAAAPVGPALRAAFDKTRRLTVLRPDALLRADLAGLHGEVDELLRQTSRLVRAGLTGRNSARADLIGAKLAGADLRGADLRGSYLIGADLRGADLRLADLIGADLRATDLRGADLSDCLFLTQFQLNAAGGDPRTTIPAALTRPGHWPVAG